ncbi:MAG: HD domain-containing protein [Firmicutes bacterium]|nr:HD domain-containing protein [Bacillota bacterium]
MDKVNRILYDKEYLFYLENIRLLEKDRSFCRHDFEHFLTVARLTYLFLLEEGCRFISREMAYSAGLLHDIGRWKEYQGGGDHATISARLAGSILERAGFNHCEQELIVKAIAQHRHDAPGEHRSPLSSALHKADGMARLCFSCVSRKDCRGLDRRPHRERLLY